VKLATHINLVSLWRGAYLFKHRDKFVSRDSVIGKATSYGLDDQEIGVRVPVGSRIFSSPRRLDRLWGPPNLLPMGTMRSFLRGKAAGA
jgi:hypothetical protein